MNNEIDENFPIKTPGELTVSDSDQEELGTNAIDQILTSQNCKTTTVPSIKSQTTKTSRESRNCFKLFQTKELEAPSLSECLLSYIHNHPLANTHSVDNSHYKNLQEIDRNPFSTDTETISSFDYTSNNKINADLRNIVDWSGLSPKSNDSKTHEIMSDEIVQTQQKYKCIYKQQKHDKNKKLTPKKCKDKCKCYNIKTNSCIQAHTHNLFCFYCRRTDHTIDMCNYKARRDLFHAVEKLDKTTQYLQIQISDLNSSYKQLLQWKNLNDLKTRQLQHQIDLINDIFDEFKLNQIEEKNVEQKNDNEPPSIDNINRL